MKSLLRSLGFFLKNEDGGISKKTMLNTGTALLVLGAGISLIPSVQANIGDTAVSQFCGLFSNFPKDEHKVTVSFRIQGGGVAGSVKDCVTTWAQG